MAKIFKADFLKMVQMQLGPFDSKPLIYVSMELRAFIILLLVALYSSLKTLLRNKLLLRNYHKHKLSTG